MVPMVIKHRGSSLSLSKNNSLIFWLYKALPLDSPEPNPKALAMSKIFCIAHPAEMSFSCLGILSSALFSLAVANKSKGPLRAFCFASSICIGLAAGSLSIRASAKS